MSAGNGPYLTPTHAVLASDPLRRRSLDALAGRNVAISGGAGFCGLNLVSALAGSTVASVRVLDDGSTGDLRQLAAFPVETRVGSVLDDADLAWLIEGAEVLFHLACSNITRSLEDPHHDLAVNALGTLRVLEASAACGLDRVVYTSTASVYGNPRHLPAHEDDPPALLSPYSVSKYAGEGYCRVAAEKLDLAVTILRLSNVYGPYQSTRNPYTGVVARWVESALEGQPLSVHGDGEQTRDFTYVEDVVTALLAAAVRPQGIGRVYNVATGREITVNDLATRIIAHSGRRALTTRNVERRDIDNIRRRVLNTERIRQDLGWIPLFTLDEGLAATVAWTESSS